MPLFTDNNTPRLINVDDTGSLSRASCSGWTAADIESLGLKEVGMDRIIAGTKEARLAGVKESSLYDLILSRHVPNLEKKSAPQGSIARPSSI